MQIDWGLIVMLLLVSIPALVVFGAYFWSKRNDRKARQEGSRFLGTQMDIAIIVFGILVLLVLASWIHQAFSG